METVTLGSTGIIVNKNGFGALPVQRVSKEEAVKLGLGEDSIYMVRGEVSFVQNRYEEAAKLIGEILDSVPAPTENFGN